MVRPLRQAWIVLAFGAIGAVILSNALFARSGDFTTFYHAAQNVLAGQPIYLDPALLDPGQQNDNTYFFKYPPWIATIFSPLALLEVTGAGIAWRLICALLSFLMIAWTLKRTQNPALLGLVTVSFWGFWVINLVTGQTVIPLAAATLFGAVAVESETQNRTRSALGSALLWLGLSTKIFPLFVLVGLRWRELKKIRVLPFALAALLLSLPVLAAFSWNIPSALSNYLSVLSSSKGGIGGGYYGLPVGFAYLLDLPVEEISSLLTGFYPSAVLGAAVLFFAKSRERLRSDFALRFALALGIASAIQPLAFTYSYVAVFPLCALAVDRAWRANESKLARLLAVTGWLAVVLLHSKASDFLGLSWLTLGFVSTKPLGVFLLAGSVLVLRPKPADQT